MNRIALGASCAAFLAAPTVALAQDAPVEEMEACAPRTQIVDKLASDFNEHQQAVGLVNDKAVLELFVSGMGTWTLIATGTDGKSCVLSAGQNWDDSNVVKGLDSSFRRPAS